MEDRPNYNQGLRAKKGINEQNCVLRKHQKTVDHRSFHYYIISYLAHDYDKNI